eukprot:5626912-Prymnesium_polylepis.1
MDDGVGRPRRRLRLQSRFDPLEPAACAARDGARAAHAQLLGARAGVPRTQVCVGRPCARHVGTACVACEAVRCSAVRCSAVRAFGMSGERRESRISEQKSFCRSIGRRAWCARALCTQRCVAAVLGIDDHGQVRGDGAQQRRRPQPPH